MPDQCPECGECELVWEDYEHFRGDAKGRCVCQSCGALVAVNQLTSDDARPFEYCQPSTMAERKVFASRYGSSQQLSQNHRQSVQFAKRIAQCIECKPGMISEVVALFERIYSDPDFLYRSMATKQHLATCCVYIVCRRHGWPVTLSILSSVTSLSVHTLQAHKKTLLEKYDDLADIKPPDMLELVEATCSKSGFSDSLKETTIKIISLCRDAWILYGRKPDNVIHAAIYLAWQSEDPTNRCKQKLQKFCQQYKFSCTVGVKQIIQELQLVLCKLAGQIPWVSTTIDQQSLPWHISDVLQYKCSLEADTVAQIIKSEVVKNGALDVNGVLIKEADANRIISSAADRDEAECSSSQTVHCSSVSAVKRKLPDDESEPAVERKSTDFTAVDHRRHFEDAFDKLYAPPSIKNAKRKRKKAENIEVGSGIVNHPDLNNEELGNHDIDDESMHLYIKDPNELTVELF